MGLCASTGVAVLVLFFFLETTRRNDRDRATGGGRPFTKRWSSARRVAVKPPLNVWTISRVTLTLISTVVHHYYSSYLGLTIIKPNKTAVILTAHTWAAWLNWNEMCNKPDSTGAGIHHVTANSSTSHQPEYRFECMIVAAIRFFQMNPRWEIRLTTHAK